MTKSCYFLFLLSLTKTKISATNITSNNITVESENNSPKSDNIFIVKYFSPAIYKKIKRHIHTENCNINVKLTT